MKLYACGFNLNGQISKSVNAKLPWTQIEGNHKYGDRDSMVAFGFSYVILCSGESDNYLAPQKNHCDTFALNLFKKLRKKYIIHNNLIISAHFRF
jgi:hypothetical protein